MKKLILTTVFAFGMFIISQAQSATFVNITNNTLQYGQVAKGSNRERVVTVKNTGKKPLIIQNATASCGCTIPEWSKEPILPGKTGTLKINYDTNRIGAFTKVVTISTNDPVTPQMTLTVTGTIKE